MYFAYFDFRANTRLIFIRGLTDCCCDESLIVACHSAESTQCCSDSEERLQSDDELLH